MANLSVDFDSPKTSSAKLVDFKVNVPVTEPGHPTEAYFHIGVTTTVADGSATGVSKTFYKTIIFTTSSVAQAVTSTFTLCIEPAEMFGATGTLNYNYSLK
ncbi:hypothetical protein SAMN02745163_03236 [Clostridium cavendishii DSM 21758]|uniref:Uncharacterized protein n=1 Tax=Clostridium cavendishii DSM 21758 TaxID=1121302 RepID=A0A1M6PRA9_9CLOT|nr:hypothetical protein [Clostridium cavendishii]SHK10466.1 hypothetical protein SAMN02745163_03236 [Clostridium cavendishii DSM 21758]